MLVWFYMIEKTSPPKSDIPSSLGGKMGSTITDALTRLDDVKKQIQAEDRFSDSVPELNNFRGQKVSGQRLVTNLNPEQAQFLQEISQDVGILSFLREKSEQTADMRHQEVYQNLSLIGNLRVQGGGEGRSGYVIGSGIFINPKGNIVMNIYEGRVGQEAAYVLDFGSQPPVFVLDYVTQAYDELSERTHTTDTARYSATLRIAEKLIGELEQVTQEKIKQRIIKETSTNLLYLPQVELFNEFSVVKESRILLEQSSKRKGPLVRADDILITPLEPIIVQVQELEKLREKLNAAHQNLTQNENKISERMTEIQQSYIELFSSLKLSQEDLRNSSFNYRESIKKLEDDLESNSQRLKSVREDVVNILKDILVNGDLVRESIKKYIEANLDNDTPYRHRLKKVKEIIDTLRGKISTDFSSVLSFYPKIITRVLSLTDTHHSEEELIQIMQKGAKKELDFFESYYGFAEAGLTSLIYSYSPKLKEYLEPYWRTPSGIIRKWVNELRNRFEEVIER